MPATNPCTCQNVTSILFQVIVYWQVAVSLYPLTPCTPPLRGVKLSISGSCRHACVPLSPTLIDNPSNWSQSGGNQTIMAGRLLFNHLWLIEMLKITRVLANSTFYKKINVSSRKELSLKCKLVLSIISLQNTAPIRWERNCRNNFNSFRPSSCSSLGNCAKSETINRCFYQ